MRNEAGRVAMHATMAHAEQDQAIQRLRSELADAEARAAAPDAVSPIVPCPLPSQAPAPRPGFGSPFMFGGP